MNFADATFSLFYYRESPANQMHTKFSKDEAFADDKLTRKTAKLIHPPKICTYIR